MNIFTELLPGARQLRTPLAIGCLWILAGWINAEVVSEDIQRNLLLRRAETGLEHLPLSLNLVLFSFAAYILGLCFEAIDEFIINAAVSIAFTGLVIAGGYAIIAVLVRGYALALLLLIAGVLVVYFRSRRNASNIWDEADQVIMNLLVPIRGFFYDYKDNLVNLWSITQLVRNELIAKKIDDILLSHPQVLVEFCETVSIGALRVASAKAGLGQNRVTSRFVEDNGRTTDMSEVAKRSLADSGSEQLLRSYLRQRMLSSSEVRKAVTLRVMDTTDIRKLVSQAVSDGIALIRAGKPKVFEQYDRSKSEGKFRCGISAPLAVVLWSVCAAFTHRTVLCLAATVPVLFLYYSGMKKQQEAERIVVSSIEAKVIKVQLDASDVKLLRWPTSSDADRPSSVARKAVEDLRPRKAGTAVDAEASVSEQNDISDS
jgi:hypothetical protein